MAYPVLDDFLLRGAMDATAVGSDRVDIDLNHCVPGIQQSVYLFGSRVSFHIRELGQENGVAGRIVVGVTSGESVRIISQATLPDPINSGDLLRLVVEIGSTSQDIQVLPSQCILIGARVHIAMSTGQ